MCTLIRHHSHEYCGLYAELREDIAVVCGTSTEIHRVELEEGLKYSPGRRRVIPYTISAAVQFVSSFSAVRMPSNTRGRASIHEKGLGSREYLNHAIGLRVVKSCTCLLCT